MWWIDDEDGKILVPMVYLFILWGNIGVTISTTYGMFDDHFILTVAHLIIWEVFTIMIVWSHLTCMLTDPGALPLGKWYYNLLIPNIINENLNASLIFIYYLELSIEG